MVGPSGSRTGDDPLAFDGPVPSLGSDGSDVATERMTGATVRFGVVEEALDSDGRPDADAVFVEVEAAVPALPGVGPDGGRAVALRWTTEGAARLPGGWIAGGTDAESRDTVEGGVDAARRCTTGAATGAPEADDTALPDAAARPAVSLRCTTEGGRAGCRETTSRPGAAADTASGDSSALGMIDGLRWIRGPNDRLAGAPGPVP